MSKIRIFLLCASIALLISVEIFRDQLAVSTFRFLSIGSILLLFIAFCLAVFPVLNSQTQRKRAYRFGGAVFIYGMVLSLLIGGVVAMAFQFGWTE